jgi:hypothetical protein
LAHAVVAGDDLAKARESLHEALGWKATDQGDLCPLHIDGMVAL